MARNAVVSSIPELVEDEAPFLGSGCVDGLISEVLARCEAEGTPVLAVVPGLVAELTWLLGVYDAARRWDARALRVLAVTAPTLSALVAKKLSSVAEFVISKGGRGLARVVIRLADIVAVGTTIDSPRVPPTDRIVYRQVDSLVAVPCAPPKPSAWSGLTGTYSFS